MPTSVPDDQTRDTARPMQSQEVLDRLEQVEEHFDQVQEGLANLQRLSTLGTLTATVAHEFNNILTPIISYAQLAMAKPGDLELSRKAHEKALKGADRASKLCASLLGYARDEDTPNHADLNRVAQSAVNCLGRGLEKDGIKLELELPDIEVAMSPSSLEQVLVNLTLNARIAMADEGGVLTLRAEAKHSAVEIEVSDTGRGVPPEIAGRLFEPFVTYDPDSSKKERKGTGLGLSVCRDLINSAGGEISFESKLGEGTTFRLRIPLAQPLRQSA